MGFIGTTCMRCGLPVAAAGQGSTCARCADLLRDKARPGDEAPRSCPVDGSPMAKLVLHGLVLDRCPTCRGVWLDGGELDLLEKAVRKGPDAHLASNVVLGMTRW